MDWPFIVIFVVVIACSCPPLWFFNKNRLYILLFIPKIHYNLIFSLQIVVFSSQTNLPLLPIRVMNVSDYRDKLYIVPNAKRKRKKIWKNTFKWKKNERNSMSEYIKTNRTQTKSRKKKTVCWTWGWKCHSSTYDYKIAKLFYGIFIYYLLRKLFIVVLMRTNFRVMFYKRNGTKTVQNLNGGFVIFAAFAFLMAIKMKKLIVSDKNSHT